MATRRLFVRYTYIGQRQLKVETEESNPLTTKQFLEKKPFFRRSHSVSLLLKLNRGKKEGSAKLKLGKKRNSIDDVG